ncbi:unnamed protein product [Pleuronectes platessa]|uniref:Uncharacterized protein n=1 Tax=Pleuronectes platessa TaxID=8262 RepID=A0A9N7UD67_PLEPL|nr:unnamed protein product [Pleuronectes platessa]
MFPIDPRQAALASASNTCTAGIVTFRFPSPCSPHWAEWPCKVSTELSGARRGAEYKLTPPAIPPPTPLDISKGRRTERSYPSAAGVTVSLQNHTSACSTGLEGARRASCGVKLVPLPKWLLIRVSRLKAKGERFASEKYAARYHWRLPVDHTVACGTVGHDHSTQRASAA